MKRGEIVGGSVRVSCMCGSLSFAPIHWLPPLVVVQPGSTLVMANRGVPVLGKPSNRGDQLVRVQVEIPKTLSAEEKDLIEKLAEMSEVKGAAVR